jgi:hypothetical protein
VYESFIGATMSEDVGEELVGEGPIRILQVLIRGLRYGGLGMM